MTTVIYDERIVTLGVFNLRQLNEQSTDEQTLAPRIVSLIIANTMNKTRLSLFGILKEFAMS